MALFNRSCNTLEKTAFGPCGSGMRWALVVVLMLLVSGNGFGQTTFTWNGNANSDWNNSLNWDKVGSSTSTYPGESNGQNDYAIIPSLFVTHQPILSSYIHPIKRIEINGNTLTIAAGGSIIIEESTTLNGGSLIYEDDTPGNLFYGSIFIAEGAIWNSSAVMEANNMRVACNIINNSNSVNFGSILIYSNTLTFSGTGKMFFLGNFNFNGNWSFNNETTIEILGQSNNTSTSSTWVNKSNSILIYANSNLLMTNPAASIDASAPNNLVHYSGSGDQTIRATTYWDLRTSGNSTKSLGGITNVRNSLLVDAPSRLALAQYKFDVDGVTVVKGSISDSHVNGINEFGKVEIDPGGEWNFSGVNSNVEIQGGITNNGTFSSGTGTYSFTTNAIQNFEGNQAIRFDGDVDIDSNVQIINLNTNTTSGLTIVGFISNTSSSILENRTIFTYMDSSMPMELGTLDASFIGNTVIYQSDNAQLIAAGGSTPYYNLTLLTSGGTSIKNIGSDLYVNGNLQIDDKASLKINEFYVYLNGNLDDNNTITDGIVEGTGMVIFSGTTGTQTVSSNAASGFILNDIEIDNTNSGVNLFGSDMQVKGNLTFTNGKLDIQGTNLEVLGNINGYDASKYVVANNTGELKQTVGNKTYPVGTELSYLPIIINNTGTSDVYGVRIISDVLTNGAVGAPIDEIEECVKQTWIITEKTPDGSNLGLTVQWNVADEGTSFATLRNNCAIGYHNGSVWKSNNSSPATIGGSFYTQNLTGVDGVGAFAVGGSCTRFGDNEKPVLTAIANRNENLDGSCSFTIPDYTGLTTATDNCTATGTIIKTQSPIGTVLTGHNTSQLITITADDGNGNTETTSFTITLKDVTKPALTAIADRNENLNGSCSFTIPDYTGLTTATDNCTATGTITKTQSPIGTVVSGHNTTHLITITADDGNGNTETTSFMITLKDVIAPTVICKPHTLNLDLTTGTATLTPDDIDNGSYDNCGIVSRTISQTNFDCTNVGLNTVRLTVRDAAGNESWCDAEVTVQYANDPNPQVTPAIDSICSGEQINLGLSSDIPVIAWKWTVSVPDSISGASDDISWTKNNIQQTLYNTSIKDTSVVYTITPRVYGTCELPTIQAIVRINPLPLIKIQVADTIICDSAQVSFTIASKNSHVIGKKAYYLGTTYPAGVVGVQSDGVYELPYDFHNNLVNLTNEVQIVKYQFIGKFVDAKGVGTYCENGTDTTITIYINPTPKLRVSVPDTIVCNSSTVTLTVEDKNGNVAGTKVYQLEIENTGGILGVQLPGEYNAATHIENTLINPTDEVKKVVYKLRPRIDDPRKGGDPFCNGGRDTTITIYVEPTFRYTIAPLDTIICNKNTITFGISSSTNALGALVFDFTTTTSGSDITGYQPSDAELPLANFSNTLTNNNVDYQTVKYTFKPRIIYAGNSRICTNGRDTAITVYVNPTPQMTVDLNLNRDSICYKEGTTFIVQSPNQDVIGTIKYNLSVSYDLGDISNVAANQDYTMSNLDQSGLINNSTEIKELTYTFTPFIDDYHPGLDCGGDPVVVKLTIVPEIQYDLWKKEFIGGRNIKCFDETNGVVRVIDLSGGAGGYKYAWPNGSVLDSARNMPAGQNYIVTVTDRIGCTRDSIFNLSQPDKLSAIEDSIVGIKCNGDKTGAIYLKTEGGSPNYLYKWSGPNSSVNSEDIINVEAGVYFLTVTDENKCSFIEMYSIPGVSAILWNSNKKEYGLYNVSCFGMEDGAFNAETELDAVGFKWTGPDGYSSDILKISNLKPGPYELIITNTNGCSKAFHDTIWEPAVLALNDSVPLYANGFNVQCEGGANGRISLSPTGGHGNYQYTWITADGDGIVPGVSSQTQLKAGTYEVKVYDGFCRDSSKITLNQPPPLNVVSSISQYSGYEVSCNNGNNGQITLLVSGGFGSYSYQWSTLNGKGLVPGAKDQTTLGAGNYSVSVTYDGVCSKPYSFTLREPGSLIIADSSKSNILCFGDNSGSLSAIAAGGVSPYTYNWSDENDIGLTPIQQAHTGLTAGTYTLFVTDKNNCTLIKKIQLTQPDSIHVDFVTDAISCSEGSDGSIEANVSGGTPQYTYEWSTGAASSKLIKVPLGNYALTVTDYNNCHSIRTVALSAPRPLVITPNILSNFNGLPVSCFGAADGEVSLDVSGGTLPYQYAWSTGASTPTISNMAAGNYKVTVYDDYGCTGAIDFTLNQPEKTSVSWLVVDNVCYGEAKGKINVTAQGGVKPYNFSWSDNNTGANRTSLLSGSYTLIFSDANNCTTSQTITINEPEKLTVEKTLLNPYCPDATDGEIVVNTHGGTWPYQYSWYNGEMDPHLTLVKPGIYMFTVTDAYNCILRDTIDFQPKYPACLDIPNAFSPNGDDKNPTWIILAGDPNNQRDLGEMYPKAIVEVFNRWGELLFRSDPGYPEPWDGKLKGRELPLDSYFYVIDPKNGSKPVTGIITVVK